MHYTEIPADSLAVLRRGSAIPGDAGLVHAIAGPELG